MAHLACLMHGKRVMVLTGNPVRDDDDLARTYHRSGGELCSDAQGAGQFSAVLTIGGNRISPFDVNISHAETIKMEARTQEYHRNRAAKQANGRRRPRG